MGFTARLAAVLAVIAALSTAAVAALGARLMENGFSDLAEARLSFVLASLRNTIQANLDLGLPLSDLRAVQDLIERAISAEPGVRTVEVIDSRGVSLFSTERGAVGEAVPASWMTAIAEQRNAPMWRATDRGDLTIGMAIENDFGQPVGHVVLALPLSEIETRGVALDFTLLRSLPLALPAGLAVLVLGLVATRRRRRNLHVLVRSLEPPGTPADGVLGQAAVAAAAATVAAAAALTLAQDELAKIDAGI